MLWALLLSCASEQDTAQVEQRGPQPSLEAAPATLRRLTGEQYENILTDVFGEEVALTSTLDEDEEIDGLIAQGSTVATVSPLGAERYETAAYQIASQITGSESLRERWIPCSPQGVRDDACSAEALEPLGWLLWRRPLTGEELDRLVEVSGEAAEVLDDFYAGLDYGIAGLMVSPHFLFRVELGESPDEAGRVSASGLASRLSFFLWNSTPDQELLDAAEAGELDSQAGLEEQVDRMLEDDRARRGLRSFFTDLLNLDQLDSLTKDPLIYLYMADDLGPSAREETLAVIEWLLWDEEGDYRDLFTTTTTWVNRRLASVYDISAPSMDDFGWTELPEDRGRRGLLGHTSFLALQAHATSSSVTLRGKFIQESLLCIVIPPPPADVDTSIPEASDDLPTMRERVERHLEDPSCASCHQLTDPVGLGLENFDGIARWRTRENEAVIDPSGELNGAAFRDAWELAEVISEQEALGPCLNRNLLRYATGLGLEEGQEELASWHGEGFVQREFRIKEQLRELATGPFLLQAGALNP